MSLQQRDCAGLSPASLLAPSSGDQIGGKDTKKFDCFEGKNRLLFAFLEQLSGGV
jgi:hypothetical protein